MESELSSKASHDPAQLFEQFSSRLVRIAERHLERRLSSRVDGEDVVQSVFRTFVRRCQGGQFQIESASEIWKLLVHITVLKACAKARYHTNRIRDARAEVSLEALAEFVNREPSPEEGVVLVDLVGRLVQGLPSWYGDALQSRLQGHSMTDIATHLNLSRQSVYRAFRVLQQRLIHERDAIFSSK